MSLELDRLDEKLDEKLEEIKLVMSQIITAQVDQIQQTSTGHDKLIRALVARMDNLDQHRLEGTTSERYFEVAQPPKRHHTKIDFPKFPGFDLEGYGCSLLMSISNSTKWSKGERI